MSETLEPISPSEAARLVAESRRSHDDQPRWHHDVPAEPQGPEYYGKEATERAQGYEPMRVANPVKTPIKIIKERK